MPTRVLSRTAAAVTACVIATAGEAQAAVPHTRSGIRLGSTAQHHVIAPSRTQPGFVHVLNTGARSLVVARKKTKPLSTFVADYNANDQAANARFYTDFDVLDIVAPHADEYLRLTSGTYYLVDAELSRATSSSVTTMTASGAIANQPAPSSTLIRTAPDGTIARSVTVPKHSYVHVLNASTSPRIVSICSIKAGVTNQQLVAAINDPVHHNPLKLIGSYFLPLAQMAGHTDLERLVTAAPARYLLFAASLTHPGLSKGKVGILTIR